MCSYIAIATTIPNRKKINNRQKLMPINNIHNNYIITAKWNDFQIKFCRCNGKQIWKCSSNSQLLNFTLALTYVSNVRYRIGNLDCGSPFQFNVCVCVHEFINFKIVTAIRISRHCYVIYCMYIIISRWQLLVSMCLNVRFPLNILHLPCKYKAICNAY